VELKLQFDILPQPDDLTCGPTCLHAIYRYYGDRLPLSQVIAEVSMLDTGGTLAVNLACHALKRGYSALLYTYNLQMFDPTWFRRGGADLGAKLVAQQQHKDFPKLHLATEAYLEFVELGGRIRLVDPHPALIRRYLMDHIPILTGLSSTFLYREAREFGPNDDHDDIRGEPAGHFVVLCGYSRMRRKVQVADPLHTNPLAGATKYWVGVNRVIGAILLGIVTYDANLLILKPKG
jgi:hypothetical protein